MTRPRIVISGDFVRPGQDGNIAFLWSALRGPVWNAFGAEAGLYVGRALPWDYWCVARIHDVKRYAEAWAGADLVIGFELPQAARTAIPRWIDIRRHPLRFDQAQAPFSFRASWITKFATPGLGLVVPVVIPVPALSDDVAIMTQMQADAALLDGTRLLRSCEVVPEFVEQLALKPHKTVWIVPHPNEPRNNWVNDLLAAIPQAKLWSGSAYEAMRSMPAMLTVSSSTGFEAPYFGCNATFLRKPEEPSAPYDLCDSALWTELGATFPG